MMFSPGCGCCGTACGTICVRPVGCLANDIHSVPISATGSGTVTGSPCTTSGTVSTVTRTAAGGGYTSAPTVSFAAGEPPGSGATGHCVMSTTNVDHLNLTAGGTGYTTAPTVTITGDGFGATATAALNPSAVATLILASGGSGYTNGLARSLTFTGGSGTGAAGTYDVAGGVIGNLVLTNGGANYTTAPAVGFASAGPGTGASATAGLTPGPVATLTLVNHGSGFNNIPGVAFSGGGGSGAIAAAVLGTRTVTSIVVDSGGSGYAEGSASFPVTLSGGGGSGAAGNANVVPQCCLGISAAGTYSVVMTAPAGTGFVDTTVPVTAGCTTQTISPTFTVSTLYTCTFCSGYPVKKAATLTIGGTAHTLTFGSNSGGVTTWTLSLAAPAATVFVAAGGVASCSGGGSSTVTVTLRCNSGQWELSYGYNVGRCMNGTGGNSLVTGHGGCGDWYPVGTASDGTGTVSPIGAPTIVAAAAPTATPLNITFPAFPPTVSVCCCPADDLSGNYGFLLPNLLTGAATLTE